MARSRSRIDDTLYLRARARRPPLAQGPRQRTPHRRRVRHVPLAPPPPPLVVRCPPLSPAFPARRRRRFPATLATPFPAAGAGAGRFLTAGGRRCGASSHRRRAPVRGTRSLRSMACSPVSHLPRSEYADTSRSRRDHVAITSRLRRGHDAVNCAVTVRSYPDCDGQMTESADMALRGAASCQPTPPHPQPYTPGLRAHMRVFPCV